jgi:hypothetical protein
VAYLLSSVGAKKLVSFVVNTGFTDPVDLTLLRFMRQPDINVYTAYPVRSADL